MTLFKGYHSIFRYLGIIGAIFAIVQAGICIFLAVIGILFFYIRPDIKPFSPIGYAYCFLYFSSNSDFYANYIDPIFFHIIMWLAVIIYGVWIYFGTELLRVFFDWSDNEEINIVTGRWILTSMAVCIFDFVIFLFFLVELLVIINDPDLNTQMTGEVIETGNLSLKDYKDEFIKNQVVIDSLIRQKIEKQEKLRNTEQQKASDLNPFVHNQMDKTENKSQGGEYYDYDYINTRAVKLNVTSMDPDILYGVWSWYAAPPAIVMTVVMKTYIGWVANVIIILVMYNLNIQRDSQVRILNAPKL